MYTVCNTFLYQRNKTLFLYKFLNKFFITKQMKKSAIKIKYRPPVFFSSFLLTNLRCKKGEVNKIQHTATENKSCCHFTWVKNVFSSAHPSSLSNTWFDFFTDTDEWRVNRAAEPKQNKTFELRSKRPTCAFNLDTPSTPRAFFSTPLNRCQPQN